MSEPGALGKKIPTLIQRLYTAVGWAVPTLGETIF